MLLHIPGVLSADQVQQLCEQLLAQPWQHGAASAGAQALASKDNFQFPTTAEVYPQLAKIIASALTAHPLYRSAVVPKHLLPPMFNCYQAGGHYGNHVDNALQFDHTAGVPVRTDVSITVFLSDPDSYEGGELVIEDTYGEHEVKLPAGDAIVYPATSLHRVEPVQQGRRLASFLWAQSWVSDAWQRKLLFDLDMSIISLRQQLGDCDEVLSLTSTYHNLLRQWSR